MGNESSLMEEYAIDESPVSKSLYWNLHHGQTNGDTQLSVFISKEDEGVFERDNLVKLMGKNLRCFRHPNILRYVGYQEVDSKNATTNYLFTEKASPLTALLSQQSSLQICLGLRDIIESLEFLHQVGRVCHNNVTTSSVFVTSDGRWKLGGMEFVQKFDMISRSFLEKSRPFRYDRGISIEEKSGATIKDQRARDVFSLGVLIEDVLVNDSGSVRGSSNDENFLIYAKNSLQAPDASERPGLLEILNHEYFSNQDYLKIVSFLVDLPLKSAVEKEDFFMNLTERLFEVPEKIVASQLSSLLLSRMVLLDKTAVLHFLPNMLSVAGEKRLPFCRLKDLNPLLSESLFKEFVTPILTKILGVREVHVRSVLLKFFPRFSRTFHLNVLKEIVLPQILLGIRDNNDSLVSATLIALADMVTLVGAATVVGQHRRKIFSDGSPSEPSHQELCFSAVESPAKLPMTDETVFRRGQVSPLLMERHSPIGAENMSKDNYKGKTTKTEADQDFSAQWDDWGDESASKDTNILPLSAPVSYNVSAGMSVKSILPKPSISKDIDPRLKGIQDCANATTDISQPIVDLFADMEPVIPKAKSIFDILDANEQTKTIRLNENVKLNSKFAVAEDVDDSWAGTEGGWEDI